MKATLVLVLMTCLGAAAPQSKDDHLRQQAARVAGYYDGVATADIELLSCGEINAFYWQGTVYLCREIETLSDATTRFFVAHELAHAAVHELGLSDEDAEARADELATLVLLGSDDEAAVLAGAEFFMRHPKAGGDGGDDHPRNLDRARMLLCLDDGGSDEPESPYCELYYRQAASAWMRLIETKASDSRACAGSGSAKGDDDGE